MPNDIENGTVIPPRRGVVWKIEEKELQGFAIPFPGADLSVMVRSQYYDATVRKSRPVHLSSYFQLDTRFKTYRLILWGAITRAFALASFTRRILLKYPDQCSFRMFKKSGPSAQQIAEASFTYWFFGYGYKETIPLDQQHERKVDRKVVATCKGPDLAYMAASGCVLSAALALVKDKNNLPKEGGVYTPAAAFGDSKIYDYLATFGINFHLESEYDL
ncbi:Saccharopine dehydrogenase-like C-terminal domain-containing protein [Caenorhabditis elegans]|uniref:Saccharopine dehydrogenase-like C-terminal domain-containing protein n=1 Tax=Caenorhabditis elegans TaxID=6239 RepID=Q9N4S9_CAEEL|nr:Saccharopine dehydrogenase-like C-terminal domain-containing protein [Caenorhabditis elegans]CCD72850.1 Saccharopine dehydrogenase-like C-terminal domain-containing protein [Caenorhabditis elegans]|eukprot:NP_503379.3 Uncharacterized protein CELE_Y50D4B.2 [Caenorhabditis elegans]